jgi:hypothetical protein
MFHIYVAEPFACLKLLLIELVNNIIDPDKKQIQPSLGENVILNHFSNDFFLENATLVS